MKKLNKLTPPHHALTPKQREEADISRSAGSATMWICYEDYEVREGILNGIGRTKRFYFPMADRGIPNIIYKLNPDNYDDLIDFARKYGGFGHWNLCEKQERTGGDPINWIKAHINGIRITFDLIEIIQSNNEEKAYQYIDKLNENETYGENEKIVTNKWYSEGSSLDLASYMVRDIINRNIKGIQKKLYQGKENTFVSFHKFNALIEVVYWQLLDAAVSGTFKRCEECNAPVNGNVRFCRPQYAEKESPCALRSRQRRSRRKRKEEKNEG